MLRSLFINPLKFFLLAFFLLTAAASHAAMNLEKLAGLPPGEQYRQLSLLLLVTGGTDPALVELLQPIADRNAGGAAGQALELDDYVTPLIRIVDQDVMLANAAGMFRFSRENSQQIQQRLTEIARSNPILVSLMDVNEIAADAIIIRTAIADSIEYSDVYGEKAASGLVQDFRGQTVYLRNMMEYNQFQEELAAITNQAIVDLGGRLDAYQRMFNENVDEDLIRRRVESAEIMNRQTGDRYEEQALARNSELLMMLILMESRVY